MRTIRDILTLWLIVSRNCGYLCPFCNPLDSDLIDAPILTRSSCNLVDSLAVKYWQAAADRFSSHNFPPYDIGRSASKCLFMSNPKRLRLRIRWTNFPDTLELLQLSFRAAVKSHAADWLAALHFSEVEVNVWNLIWRTYGWTFGIKGTIVHPMKRNRTTVVSSISSLVSCLSSSVLLQADLRVDTSNATTSVYATIE